MEVETEDLENLGRSNIHFVYYMHVPAAGPSQNIDGAAIQQQL